MRETLPGTQNSAAYMEINNHSDQDRVIVKAHSPKVTRVEMHTQDKDGTMMVMRPVSEVTVPAHGQFKFQSGGHHFMLIGIEGALKAGESLPFQLIFADGTQLNTSLPVQAIGGEDKSGGMKHHNHTMH